MAPAVVSWREKMKSLLQEDLNDLRGSHDITQSEDSEVLDLLLLREAKLTALDPT